MKENCDKCQIIKAAGVEGYCFDCYSAAIHECQEEFKEMAITAGREAEDHEKTKARVTELESDAKKDYEGMREFQAKFIKADQELRVLREDFANVEKDVIAAAVKAYKCQLPKPHESDVEAFLEILHDSLENRTEKP